MQRHRETAPQRILVFCVWALILLFFMGQTSVMVQTGHWQNALLFTARFFIGTALGLVPPVLYAVLRKHTHGTLVSVLVGVIWSFLFLCLDIMFFAGGNDTDLMMSLLVLTHTYSYLAFGKLLPPSGDRTRRKFMDGGTL